MNSTPIPDVSVWRVIAVDDELDNLTVIGDLLELSGAAVMRCQSGAEALAALDTFQPTLILLDLLMPTMDGWEVFRQIRQRPDLDSVAVVALTALAESADDSQHAEVSFDGYVVKPFFVPVILGYLADVIAKKAHTV